METYDVYKFFCMNAELDGKMFIMTEKEALETAINYEAECVKITTDEYTFDDKIYDPYDVFNEEQ